MERRSKDAGAGVPLPPEGAPMRACTVQQLEARHPATAGRLRSWVHRADAGDATFAALKPAIIRIGRSLLIDEPQFERFLRQHSSRPPAPNRRRWSAR